MLATLCSYEDRFCPCHPQTLILMTRLGITYWQVGQFDYARPLLETAVRDLGRKVGRDCEARLQAMTVLRDLFSAECDFERASAIERELVGQQEGMKMDEEGIDFEYSSLGKFILSRQFCRPF
jgi:hypothetical protein